MLTENDIAKRVVNAAFEIHSSLGPGMLESVYEVVLARELKDLGLHVERQKPIAIRYKDMTFEEAFRADIILNRKVIVEIKSVETVLPVHKKQLLTYLKLTDMRLGLLINFGAPLIKEGIFRIVNGLTE